MVGESEPARRQGQREYQKDDFVVTWEPALCIHSANSSEACQVFSTPRHGPGSTLTAPSAIRLKRWLTPVRPVP